MFLGPIQTVSVSRFLDGILAAERAHPVQHVLVDTVSTVTTSPSRTTVDLRLDRSAGRFLLTLHSQSANGKSLNRVFYVAGGKLTAFDQDRNEYLVRPLTKGRTLGEDLIAKAEIDPGVLVAIDPSAADKILFKNLRALEGWTETEAGGAKELRRENASNGKTSRIDVGARSADQMPTEFTYLSNGRGLSSTITYEKPTGSIAFAPPPSSRKVAAFSQLVKPPHFETPAAEIVAEASRTAYANLRSISMKIEGDDAASVSWQSGAARQSGAQVSWAYDGQTLTILVNARRRFYRGKVSRASIPDYLSAVGAREEPLLLQLMSGENPMAVLYASGQAARLAGSITVGGASVDILEISSPTVRTQIQVRQSDHLIVGLKTENLAPNRTVLSHSEKSFNITETNRQQPANMFKLTAPSGYKVLSLDH